MRTESEEILERVIEKIELLGSLKGGDINPIEYEVYDALEEIGWVKITRGLFEHSEYLSVIKTDKFNN